MIRFNNYDIEKMAGIILKKLGNYPEIFEGVDIEDIIRKQGYKVTYRPLCDDGSVCGVTSYTGSVARINVNGAIEEIFISPTDIIIDATLFDEKKYGRRRFTLAHEYAHHILDRYDECYCAERNIAFDRNRVHYSRSDVEYSFDESQTNQLAGCLLMPKDVLEKMLYMLGIRHPIPVYGGNQFYRSDYCQIKGLAGSLSVSRAALVCRLRQINMLEFKPFAEYDYSLDTVMSMLPHRSRL